MPVIRPAWSLVSAALVWAMTTGFWQPPPPAPDQFDPAGRLVARSLDLDGDGRADTRRHYLYGPDGQLSGVLDSDP